MEEAQATGKDVEIIQRKRIHGTTQKKMVHSGTRRIKKKGKSWQ
jgi:hypothetical protein